MERGEEILFFVVTVITEKFLRFGDIEMNIPGACGSHKACNTEPLFT